MPDSELKDRIRTVRCGKCMHLWIEGTNNTSYDETHLSLREMAHHQQELVLQKVGDIKEKIAEGSKEAFKKDNLIEELKIGAIAFATLSVLIVMIFLLGHQYIVMQWPKLQQTYIAIGWVEEEVDELILYNVTYRREYKDGAMQLIVEGGMLSSARKTQVIPELIYEAVGGDGSVMESWKRKPPQVTIKPNGVVSFTNSFISPKETVTEVRIKFSKDTHDKQ